MYPPTPLPVHSRVGRPTDSERSEATDTSPFLARARLSPPALRDEECPGNAREQGRGDDLDVASCTDFGLLGAGSSRGTDAVPEVAVKDFKSQTP